MRYYENRKEREQIKGIQPERWNNVSDNGGDNMTRRIVVPVLDEHGLNAHLS